MRKIPRSFFWIDQQIIRSGLWLRLSTEAKLAYVVIAASADREGVSHWGSKKMMEMMGSSEGEAFDKSLEELETLHLIVRGTSEAPGIRLLNILNEADSNKPSVPPGSDTIKAHTSGPPIIIHTTTTVTLGESRAEPRSSN